MTCIGLADMSHYFLYFGGKKKPQSDNLQKAWQLSNPSTQLQKQAALYGRSEERGMATCPYSADKIQADQSESNVLSECELMFLKSS